MNSEEVSLTHSEMQNGRHHELPTAASDATYNSTDSDKIVAKIIDNLAQQDINQRKSSLKQLQEIINIHGINQPNIMLLFDLILEVQKKIIQTNEKIFIVKHLLLPNNTFTIPWELLYKIISSIGYPRTYFDHNGKKVTQKKLSMNLQTQLLKWLIASIHLFGKSIFKKLHRLLPILFNLLSFEYLRPYVVNLIFIIVLNANNTIDFNQLNKFNSNLVLIKHWQIQLVVDLLLKFPHDDSLRNLLLLFKEIMPNFDFKTFVHPKIFNHFTNLNFLSKISSVIKYPNIEYLEKLNTISKNHNQSITENTSHNNRNSERDDIMNSNLNQYHTFNRMLKKRRKLNNYYQQEITDIEMLNPDLIAMSSYNLSNLQSLVLKLNKINYLNFSHLSNQSAKNTYHSKFIINCLILKFLINDNDPLIIKFNNFVNNNIEDLMKYDNLSLESNISSVEPSFEKFLELQCILPDLFKNSKFDKIFHFKTNKFKTKLIKFKCIRNLNFQNYLNYQQLLPRDNLTVSLKNNKLEKYSEILLVRYLIEISNFILNWDQIMSDNNNNNDYKDIHLATMLKHNFNYFDANFDHFTVIVQLSFVKIFKSLQFMAETKPSNKQVLKNMKLELLPIPLINKLLLTNNPLIISETCGYIIFIKNLDNNLYNDTNHNSNNQITNIQNNLIMDTINFIWRDKAFHYLENSNNNGMYLTPKFIDNLPTLNTFSSNLTQLNTIGNLFHSPAWSYITAEIIWKFEDNIKHITKRHPGPITDESVENLIHNKLINWINMNYEQIKVHVLKELDKLGYKGLGDLLFSSLRSLESVRDH